MKSVELRIREIMLLILKLGADELNEDTSLNDVERWDSLRHMSLISALEDEFDVEFSAQQIGKMNSLGRIIREVSSELESKS